MDGQATPTWDAYLKARQRSGASIRLRLFRDGVEFELDVALDRSLRLDSTTVVSVLGILDDPTRVLN